MRPTLRPDADRIIQMFIATKVAEADVKGVVVGLSGGIDSALVTRLCVNAIGADKVLNLFLPSEVNTDQDLEDVRKLSRHLGTELLTISLAPMLESYEKVLPSLERRELRGNLMARMRMSILYHYSRMQGRLVMGTGNKSELLMGYFTKHGDGGVDHLPIGDLYKTQVWELSRKLGLPSFVIEKEPSAGLWAGQTDEGEMGITYQDLDRILFGMEQGLEEGEIIARTGLERKLVRMVRKKHLASAHKRSLPAIPQLGARLIGPEWKTPPHDP